MSLEHVVSGFSDENPQSDVTQNKPNKEATCQALFSCTAHPPPWSTFQTLCTLQSLFPTSPISWNHLLWWLSPINFLRAGSSGLMASFGPVT